MEENKNVKYFEVCTKEYPIERFKYSLLDIQFENISEGIRDDDLRIAILNPQELKPKINEEREAILYDLALLENTGECRNQGSLHEPPLREGVVGETVGFHTKNHNKY